MHPLLRLGDEVATALHENRPVVALESTVLAHGLPFPENAETALAIGKAVRAGGAVPAIVGLAGGRILVGLSEAEIDRFATTDGIPKVSNRDIGAVLAGGGLGAATVAAALVAAELAGITVFATGGIGGVHRRAQETFDISADLVQLTRSRVAVVCAGAKSILDLRLTLEYLETAGVPVIGYRSGEFPAFYVRSSGLPVPQRLDDVATVSRAITCHWQLPGTGSVLVTAPIAEADALDGAEMEAIIERALAAADADGMTGPAITPYLMKAVSRATAGRTATANRAVLIGSAHLAGALAAALSNVPRTHVEEYGAD